MKNILHTSHFCRQECFQQNYIKNDDEKLFYINESSFTISNIDQIRKRNIVTLTTLPIVYV